MTMATLEQQFLLVLLLMVLHLNIIIIIVIVFIFIFVQDIAAFININKKCIVLPDVLRKEAYVFVRMLLKLHKYDLEVLYTPGKNMFIAEKLSRDFLETKEENDTDHDFVVHELALALAMSDEKRQLFSEEICNE
ncbi:Hypothetical protein CINCED_3A022866 [Cinara cedri]|uniref:Reverse transcriptase RNase H-like domain-containing protein n=1 Tax=Cinara cedri TaxID=506608 RepID=A0A5E4M9L6_9HEMI|nr:Hypothetical protein CINCED_3A022866 [Cinara cedri]